MTTLLIINSLLVGVGLYFVRDFHRDFKSLVKSVNGLNEKFVEHSSKVNTEIKSVHRRVDKLEESEKL